MGRTLRCVAVALTLLAFEARAQAEANLQSLFVALTQGTEATLVTPLPNGMAEVTSFTPPARLSAADAAGALERARQQLAALGVAQPSGQQLAIALVGGTVDIPSGRTQLAGVMPASAGGGRGVLRTQVVAAGALPQGQIPGAAGAALTHAEVAQALQLATQQLALHGIVNPTADQIRIAMFGGTLTPPSGPAVVLPGVVQGAAALPGNAPAAPNAAVGGGRAVVPSR
jgi:hypothetical protein